MKEGTKIEFRFRRIAQIEDFTDVTEMLFPGNPNQQYAAACILFELKWAEDTVPSLTFLETKYGFSRRIMQRTRAKLARIGLIEHVSNLSARYAGRAGWKLSGRFNTALRGLADKVGHWRDARESHRRGKEELLLEVARPVNRRIGFTMGSKR